MDYFLLVFRFGWNDTNEKLKWIRKQIGFSGINWIAFAIFEWIVCFVIVLHFWVIKWSCLKCDENQMPFLIFPDSKY